MVIQGIKDRSRIREHIVTRKQGCGDEGESRVGKLGEDSEMGDHGKKRRSGKIQGRSIDLRCGGGDRTGSGSRARSP